ncbi:phospholipase DDHD1-like [Haliotis rufescens]|uniref:phospholipase DDHD1-like n=1 Tax=Haliotis rufescens TaxID=6454 RepID=UPI00201EF0E2|nr:phospholipase DDHD1-like [Haliotis rufescens]
MEFPSPADFTIKTPRGSSSSSAASSSMTERMYSLDSFLQERSNLSDDEDFDLDSSGTRSPFTDSPSHKKYLFPQKEFVDELRPEEIRWFYKNEGEKRWRAFIGYDSLRIECRYRALACDSDGDIDVNERILVRGGLYDVEVENKKCHPIYWTGDVSEIMRGTWYYDGSWQPMEEVYALQIETEHMANFANRRLDEVPAVPQKGPRPVIHNLKFQDFHVDWNAPNEIYLFSESASSKLMRQVTKSLGWQKSGSQLHRGYRYEAMMEDKPPDIAHLVFVVHGIGQKMETGAIVKCCKDLRERVVHLKQKYFPDFDQHNKRSEFLPVEWRSSLKLDGDTVESITPHKMRGMRNILNSSAMDILYYTSPLYRSEITHSLQHEMNRLYALFCSRHPYFEVNGGKVSVVAHSLGCVITYDIITGWNPMKLYDEFVTSVIDEESENAEGSNKLQEEMEQARKRVNELEASLKSVHEKQVKAKQPLQFKLENLFCLGSPLAVFLALRGIRPQSKGTHDHILPTSICKRLFNIYHPSDPVAYRLEPLCLKHYATITPLLIHFYDSSKKTPYLKMKRKAYAAFKSSSEESDHKGGKMDDSTEGSGAEEQDSPGQTRKSGSGKGQKFSLSKWLTDFRANKKGEDSLAAELKMLQKMDSDAEKLQVKMYMDPKDIDKTELEYRLDYQLRERSLENSYMSVLTSHFCYWTNKDIAYFMLTHLHPELQEP